MWRRWFHIIFFLLLLVPHLSPKDILALFEKSKNLTFSIFVPFHHWKCGPKNRRKTECWEDVHRTIMFILFAEEIITSQVENTVQNGIVLSRWNCVIERRKNIMRNMWKRIKKLRPPVMFSISFFVQLIDKYHIFNSFIFLLYKN